MTDSITQQLLLVHRGDDAALQRLIAEHLPWIERHVRRKLSAVLRRDGDTQDFVQEALVEVLRDGPRFVVENRAAFRALLARIVENNLRDRFRHLHRDRRDVRRQRAIPSDSVLMLDGPARTITEPPVHAERSERQAWMRLALEMLSPDDREVIRLRVWEGRTFADIGTVLNLGDEAVRMRYRRALPRLAEKLELLRKGCWQQSLDETPDGAGSDSDPDSDPD
ncbi:MAG: sigma-70 family RNA polymerase sigma factor [Planctomycetes bacterium]|nr:sigma-70 family RNA polymerase sigma factor [Planctomycetota bacterium]